MVHSISSDTKFRSRKLRFRCAFFSRIGRFREKRYQLTAARRNDAIIKYDHNLETARYFERECNRAKQFNSWNAVQSAKESKRLAISRRAKSLCERREKLKDLLEKEAESYARESERLKFKSVPTIKNYSLASALEKKQEDCLYNPRPSRRFNSYFCGNYSTSKKYERPVLRDFNERNVSRKVSSRLSMENTNLRQEGGNQQEHSERTHDERTNVDSHDGDQKGYNERMDAYKENSRSARASNLYGPPEDSGDGQRTTSAKYEYRPAAGLETCDHRPRTRRLHDSHFLLGNQTHLQEEGGDHMPPNQKFQDRYANRSLESTNVDETAGQAIEEGSENESRAGDNNREDADNPDDEARQLEQDETDRACENEEDRIQQRNNEEKQEGVHYRSSSMDDNASLDSREGEEEKQQQRQSEMDEMNEQRDIDREVGAKASAGRSDHRHFETEKSLPWMRMVPGDKNLSEQMFLYLTHNELKGQIQDLEKRENQACSKHQWDEALRLRDMRNRLDLARERNLYRRDDLMLDPEIKKLGMAAIEARQKLLKQREELCTNSSMYSEEAKIMWDQWVIEDRTSVLVDARLQREDLMNQLEENWRSLAVDDKQRITDSFKDKDIMNVALQSDHENSCAFRPASR